MLVSNDQCTGTKIRHDKSPRLFSAPILDSVPSAFNARSRTQSHFRAPCMN